MLGYIYKIKNSINSKIYIGQTVNLYKRWSKHKSVAKNKSYNYKSPLYDAINKYGIDKFSIEIVEECDASQLEIREKYWISTLNTIATNGYNLSPGGKKLFAENNPFYGKQHSNETKSKISKNKIGRVQLEDKILNRKIINAKERNPFYGKHHTEETKRKISESNFKNNVYEEASKRMKENNPNKDGISKRRKCRMLDLKTKQIIKTFDSLTEAGDYCKKLNLTKSKCPSNQIKDTCKGYQKTAFGFFWEYIEKDVSTNENNN